ncbi:MAG: phosphatase PAP2 family protein [Candidatus Heimdallarchaeota archaeon]|nr:phosphatase PAP2 family protein [Candidatus Heimdallarchaeota archaeon]MCK4768769.1 phosphatase PAP2 family protein [Candidatus Heimdallarchaeota archaeon]
MKKRNLIAIIMAVTGIIFMTVALLLVYLNDPIRGTGSIDWVISTFFQNLDIGILNTIMGIITYLGEAIIYIALLVILYYLWDKKKAYRAITMLVSSSVVNSSAKAAFRLDRPTAINTEIEEISFGLPSGHTQLSTTFWGVLSAFITKWGMLTVSIILPILIAFSRIYLVVHWFTDVLMGFGIGFIILAIFLVVLKPIENYFEDKSTTVKIIWSILVGILFATPIVLLHYSIPSTGIEQMISNLRYIVVFITVSISYSIEGQLIDFSNEIEKWWKGVLRVLLAVVVLAGVYFYGSYVEIATFWIQATLDLVIYALLGPVIILLLPWIMKKLNI